MTSPLPLWHRPWFVNFLRTTALMMTGLLLLGFTLNAIAGLPQESDFVAFRASALAAASGERLYQMYVFIYELQQIVPLGAIMTDQLSHNLNPPIFTFLMLPLNTLSLSGAFLAFGLLQFFLALLVFWKLSGHIAGRSAFIRPAVTLLLAGFFPVMANLLIGQVGLLLFVFFGMGWLALDRKDNYQAGLWLGLALLLKIFSGLLFIWLALTGRWKAFFTGAAVYASGMLLALAVFGTGNHLDWLQTLLAHKTGASTWNASLEGMYVRYLGAGHVASYYNVPLLVLALRITSWSLAAAALIWTARQKTHQKNSFNCGFALSLALMLLLSPLGWIYYFPILFIALLLLWRETQTQGQRLTLVLAGLMSGIPQLIANADFYWPALWRSYTQTGPQTTDTYYWFQIPELHTLALLLFAILPVWIVYSRRSAHTGA